MAFSDPQSCTKSQKNPLDLLKARTLADSIVNVQDDDGRIPTWWERDTSPHRDADWLNCMVASAAVLRDVAEMLKFE